MKVALVTGGTRGIGRAIVASLAEQGFMVCFFYHQAHEQAKSLEQSFGAKGFAVDVRCFSAVKKTVNHILNIYHHIDVLVNNVGIAQTKLFTDLNLWDWHNMMATNLHAVFYVTQSVLPSMISRKKGKIINISSIWAMRGASCEVHYSASKGAMLALTQSLAQEVAPSGICVNAVSPGAIDTDMLSTYTEEEKQVIEEQTPLTRLGKAEEVADMVAFLASDKANFITGQNFVVDGGYTV